MSTKELSVFMYSTCPSRELDHFLGWAASWSGTVHTYGWNSVRKFGRLRGTYDELRATQSTCSIAFATLIDIELCDTNLIHSFLAAP